MILAKQCVHQKKLDYLIIDFFNKHLVIKCFNRSKFDLFLIIYISSLVIKEALKFLILQVLFFYLFSYLQG
jgi:hypothetical protein